RSSRVLATIALLFVAPWAILLGAIAIAFWPRALEGDLPGALALTALAAGVGWVAYRIFREAFPGRAYIALAPGSLVLWHPVLLRRRLEIPMTNVERVDVELPDETGLEGWVLPLASHVATDLPNVVVLFREPVDLTSIRRKPISSASGEVVRVCDVDYAMGFSARAVDPEAVARSFAGWRLLSSFRSDVPDEPGARLRARDVVMGIVGIAFLLESVWNAFSRWF
ncbi:MAG TPA: hypothetical protein VHN37_12915, partial [Actinomycetota bacterium]|nr:hypothetical protein [Actinomycetota bacterium]